MSNISTILIGGFVVAPLSAYLAYKAAGSREMRRETYKDKELTNIQEEVALFHLTKHHKYAPDELPPTKDGRVWHAGTDEVKKHVWRNAPFW